MLDARFANKFLAHLTGTKDNNSKRDTGCLILDARGNDE